MVYKEKFHKNSDISAQNLQILLINYINSPTFGSKFFIHPNGNVRVCIGEEIGNIIDQSPEEIFSTKKWENFISKFEACKGCWNACYTPFSTILNFFHLDLLRNYYKIVTKN